MLSVIICKIICEVLADRQHEGWSMVFDFFFTNDEGANITYEKRVADAVTDMICEYLPDDVELNKSDVDLLYSLYADYADEFEERIRGHILCKIYRTDFFDMV